MIKLYNCIVILNDEIDNTSLVHSDCYNYFYS